MAQIWEALGKQYVLNMGSSLFQNHITQVFQERDDNSHKQFNSFTDLAYDVSLESKVLCAILSNDSGRKAFINFLRSEEVGRTISKLTLTTTTTTTTATATNNAFERIVLDDLLGGYQLLSVETEFRDEQVPSATKNIQAKLSSKRNIVQSSQSETAILLALEGIPRFITSEFFKDWQAVEMSRDIGIVNSNQYNTDVTIPEMLSADPPLVGTSIIPHWSSQLEVPPPPLESVAVSGPVEDNIIDEAMKNVDYLEIDRILRSESWLFTFIAYVEILPVCISLASARKDRIGFPLIYVNKFFETISGYNRSDIMGTNCKFLQRDGRGIMRSEADSVERLSNALRNAEPIKVAITNFRKNGSPFKNMLAIKPVFSTTGEYEYVIGVQFDISSQRSSAYALRLADSLIRLLPSVVTN